MSYDSNQSKVIWDFKNQVAILTDLVLGKHGDVQNEPHRSDIHDIKDKIEQLSVLIIDMNKGNNSLPMFNMFNSHKSLSEKKSGFQTK